LLRGKDADSWVQSGFSRLLTNHDSRLTDMLTRLALALVWLLRFLPLQLLAPIGRELGFLLYLLGRGRREVVLTNLRLCFPQWTDAERRRIGRAHFQAFGRGLLEHGILWWSSKARVQRLVRIEGIEHWQAVAGRVCADLLPGVARFPER
jgi:KDO2-lipid IV(A) lauroyltransferase